MSGQRSLAILGLAGLALAACASQAELRQADVGACQSYGFIPGTGDFAACMQREQLARAQSGGIFPSFGLGFGTFGGFGGGGLGFGL